nr:YbaL family putative K(+) efflux transporter [Govania unica]
MPLITMLVSGLGLAFILGAIAHRLKISPLVGYLLAGVILSPLTPGITADTKIAAELAEVGVILLMFGVGLHFSFKDLLSVKAIAVPGAVVQITIATLLGMGLAYLLGWPLISGFVFGMALSCASTVVLLRAMQERRLIETERGRIAVGWLIVEDLAMILALVFIPAIAGLVHPEGLAEGVAQSHSSLVAALAITIGKVIAFFAVMLIIGRRVIPWILHHIAHTGSRELFRLAVLAIALCSAYGAAVLFEVSFALGAFFAGMILSSSPLSHRAAEETLPLRDAFAVLFFVSVGMLFDPKILLNDPLPVLATLGIILFGKSIAAFYIVRAFGHPTSTAFTISASLAQIGEFSFILASLGVSLGILPKAGQDYILAGAILSILANPILFTLIDRLKAKLKKPEGEVAEDSKIPPKVIEEAAALLPTSLHDHMVVIGFGSVGRLVVSALKTRAVPFLVVEMNHQRLEALRAANIETMNGNGVSAELLQAANVTGANCLFVTVPDTFEAGQIVSQARASAPDLKIIARAQGDEEVDHLVKCGASIVVMGEREIARGMIADIFGEEPPQSAPQVA